MYNKDIDYITKQFTHKSQQYKSLCKGAWSVRERFNRWSRLLALHAQETALVEIAPGTVPLVCATVVMIPC